MVEHPLMTAREVAKLFRVDVKTVYSWVQKGKLDNVATPTGGVRLKTSQVTAILNGSEIMDEFSQLNEQFEETL